MPLEQKADVDASSARGASDPGNRMQINEQGKDEAAVSLEEAGSIPALETDDLHSQMAIERLREMDHRIRTQTKCQMLQLQSSHPVKVDSPKQDGDRPKQTTKPISPGARENSLTAIGSFPAVQETIRHGRGRDNDMEESDETNEGDEGLDDSYGASYTLAAARPPPVNSRDLPIPWRGRLGYACLNTYLRAANIPIFSSRTCQLASIINHRHPLRDPSEPEHPITNSPDRSKTPDVALGKRFIQGLSSANIRDMIKIVRWNDKYGIKFMRLSSGMCPFASHALHGYKLEPFASGDLAEAGKVIAELGHRVITHLGQYTQLGSPLEEVIAASIRDLEYHDEMLSLLNLPPQEDRDAVMMLHIGGTSGDKTATLDRFRHTYTTRLLPSARDRLVLKNDDVSWSVHDLLPICEELSIPLVLDYHHHNIVFDSRSVREGTLDISEPALADRIAATWTRKGITQSLCYSEARPGAVTPRDRRKHANRVATLPPCPPGADLMIEAEDNEQAVFELMRTFKLPGFEKINDMIPHEREDEYWPPKKVPKKRKRKNAGEVAESDRDEDEGEEETQSKTNMISPEEVAMGGPMNRVYWPVGMEDWLRPKKRHTK